MQETATIAAAAHNVAELGAPRLIVDATGILSDATINPEKALRTIDADAMARVGNVIADLSIRLIQHPLDRVKRGSSGNSLNKGLA